MKIKINKIFCDHTLYLLYCRKVTINYLGTLERHIRFIIYWNFNIIKFVFNNLKTYMNIYLNLQLSHNIFDI